MIIKKFAKWMLCAGLAAASATVKAGPIEFDFKDPKKVNNALFLLDAPLESISASRARSPYRLLVQTASRSAGASSVSDAVAWKEISWSL